MTALLETSNLVCGHGKIVAVRSLDMELQAGQVMAVLGPNGAGKTTLMETIAGLLPRISGDVTLEGKSMPSGKPAPANLSGVVLVPDNRALFTTLTVRENIEIARIKGQHRVDEMVDLFPALAKRLKIKAGALSGGEQQMLAMARALMSDPSVIILDEPSLGLAPKVVTEIMSALGHLRDEKGLAVLLVEQNVRAAFKIADRVMVMDRGRVVAEGTPAELASDERVRAAYLGGSSTSSSGIAAPVTRSGGPSA